MYYLSGQGSYIISPEVGIIEIVFDRIDGSTARFEYIESEQFTQKYKLSGTVVDSGGAPQEGVAVIISIAGFGISDTTDSSGNFNIAVYGPAIQLYAALISECGLQISSGTCPDFRGNGQGCPQIGYG